MTARAMAKLVMLLLLEILLVDSGRKWSFGPRPTSAACSNDPEWRKFQEKLSFWQTLKRKECPTMDRQPEQQQQQVQQQVQNFKDGEIHKRENRLTAASNSSSQETTTYNQRNLSSIFNYTDNSTQVITATNDPTRRLYLSTKNHPGFPEQEEFSKTPDELGADDDLDKLVFGRQEPYWMDACLRHPVRTPSKVRSSALHQYPSEPVPELMAYRRERWPYIEVILEARNKTIAQPYVTDAERAAQWDAYKFELRVAAGKYQTVSISDSTLGTRTRRSAPATTDNKWSQLAALGTASSSAKWAINPLNDIGFYHHKTAVLWKRPSADRAVNSKWATKMTSFSLSPAKSMGGLGARSKKRLLVAQQVGEPLHVDPDPKWPPSLVQTGAEEREKHERLRNIVIELYKINIRMTWHTIGGVITVHELKRKHEEFIQTLGNFVQSLNKTDNRRRVPLNSSRTYEIEEARRKWFPSFDELTLSNSGRHSAAGAADLFNITGSLYQEPLQQLLLNLTHYLQFFAVAMEQVKFEQVYSTRSKQKLPDSVYKPVDDLMSETLCICETLHYLATEFTEWRRKFNQLYASYKPAKIDGFQRFFELLVNQDLPRDRKPVHSGVWLESPFGRAFANLNEAAKRRVSTRVKEYIEEGRIEELKRISEAKFNSEDERHRLDHVKRSLDDETAASSVPSYAWREVMPPEQRRFRTDIEQAVRNLSIFGLMRPVLDSLYSLFHSNSN